MSKNNDENPKYEILLNNIYDSFIAHIFPEETVSIANRIQEIANLINLEISMLKMQNTLLENSLNHISDLLTDLNNLRKYLDTVLKDIFPNASSLDTASHQKFSVFLKKNMRELRNIAAKSRSKATDTQKYTIELLSAKIDSFHLLVWQYNHWLMLRKSLKSSEKSRTEQLKLLKKSKKDHESNIKNYRNLTINAVNLVHNTKLD